ncbi:MAG: alcohol dehydrogenase catalytic domain-containing protein, partial [Staphylococcus warneri]|nr:alcohol dehydrogenase catalytic domain-containing protein [Staphylococcus warneri]
MKAYNYAKPGVAQLIDKEKPVITESTDAIIRMVKTTICGTDLHIIKGDTPEVPENTTL